MCHLLLHCSMVWERWSVILGLFGIHWVMPCNVLDLWARWQGHLSDHQNMVVWKIVPHCLMWYLWRERNARHFEDYKRYTLALKLLFFQTLYSFWDAPKIFPSLIKIKFLISYCFMDEGVFFIYPKILCFMNSNSNVSFSLWDGPKIFPSYKN